MKVVVFDVHPFERETLMRYASSLGHQVTFLETRLDSRSAKLAAGFSVVCAFANDCMDAGVLNILKNIHVKLIALRCAGFNHIDIKDASRLGIPVVRVSAYSPYAVAEYAMALILTLNRNIHRAYMRVRELNFSLEGLIGFDLYGKTVGIVGTGRIGAYWICRARCI